MKSNYKRIGQYVRQVKTRNKSLALSEPKGININKVFMPSVANTTGTDLSKYRVVSQYQFAYNPMHVGRDEALPIAMLEAEENVIVSPAYMVFEVINTNEILPEYLMMWCRRPEFDRNAWFTTDSSVRGGFNWDDFCNMELPVPHIDKQREIVREYNVLVDRIKLNEQLCAKLEEMAQALYKHWFVDFEFPISAEYAAFIGKPELEGKPYKSNSGKMKYCEALEGEIPIDWDAGVIGAYGAVVTGKTPSSNHPDHFGGHINFVTPTDFKGYGKFVMNSERCLSEKGRLSLKNKVLPSGSLLVTCIGSDMGKVAVSKSECITNQQINTVVFESQNRSDFLYYYLKSIYSDLRNMAIGSSTMLMINKAEFQDISVPIPDDLCLQSFHDLLEILNNSYWIKANLNAELSTFLELLLAGIASKGEELAA
jgi:type I restriction enzyme, S subunit